MSQIRVDRPSGPAGVLALILSMCVIAGCGLPEPAGAPSPHKGRIFVAESTNDSTAGRRVRGGSRRVAGRRGALDESDDVPASVVNFVRSGELPPPDTTGSLGQYEGQFDYFIGPHDLIEVSVFQAEELSKEVRVNSRGKFSLPLIGTIQAGGKTVAQLEEDIASRLKAEWMNDPQVSIFVQEFTSQRVTVEGAVKKPGVFPITGRTTLLQAIAVAEGLDPVADPKAVVIFRLIDGEKKAALFDLPEIRKGLQKDPLVFGNDIIVVDRSGSRSFLKGVTDTLRGFIGFGSVPVF